MFASSSSKPTAGSGGDGMNAMPPPPPSADSRFSLEELRKIHQQLIENKTVDEDNKSLVVEILRVIAEMVVYGDNKSELLFDFFCEKNMLQLFLEIMWSKSGCPISVHVQILQTLSILISCVKNDTSLYYLLSNNYINDIISFPHNFAADESLVAQFASFMKSLSLRLNVQTVQFFFKEDTGAFPLLTKAVELLSNKDPMIRISAQTTILNVYHVDEQRSRAYALQDDVMAVLFEGIVKIMKDQVAIIQKHAIEFIKVESDLTKLRQSLEDVGVAVEDWLYYLQDVMDLKIDVLQRALSAYLLNNFVKPFLLNAVVTAHMNLNQAYQIGRMSSLEIDSSDKLDSDKGRKSLSFTDDVKQEQDAVVLAMATTAMFYFLQMCKILTSPIYRQTAFTVMSHPLSDEMRQGLLSSSVDDQPFDKSTVDSVWNPYKEAFQYFLASDHQLAVLLIMYIYHTMFVGACDGDSMNTLEGQQSTLSLLESIQVIPAMGLNLPAAEIDWSEVYLSSLAIDDKGTSTVLPAENSVVEASWKKRNCAKKSVSASSYSQEFLSPAMLTKLTAEGSTGSSPLGDDINSCCQMLLVPHTYSLTALQVSVHAIVAISKLLYTFGKNYHAANPHQEVFDGYGTQSLQYIVKQARLASRNAASTLLSRFDSHFSEMLLILVNEEIKRFNGRKWKVVFPRMMTEKMLMAPESPRQLLRLGIDFELPISQVEIIRREVQHFLMMRALVQHLSKYNLFNSKSSEFDIFDLSMLITDKDLISVDEINLIPDHLLVGNTYDMKGKKFLDTKLFSEEEIRPSGAVSPQPTQSSNWFGFGGSKKASSSSKPGSEKPAVSSKDKEKYLFVQDPNLLIIIQQKRVDGKSTFKIHAMAPLLYADAKLDLTNKKKFTVMVRSWKGLQNFNRIDLDGDDDIDESPMGFSLKKFDSYLKIPERSSIYQITLSMDSEQASALAVQHIESRRKALTAIKMENFKTLLGKWSSENASLDNE